MSLDQVDPSDRMVECTRCKEWVIPDLSERGPHIRADCPKCGRYVKFVKRDLPPAKRAYLDARKGR